MGPEATEGHHDRQGGADRPALPLLQHGMNFPLLAFQVKRLTPMLGMVVHDDAAADRHLIAWLHGH